jgi:hypothetical protein
MRSSTRRYPGANDEEKSGDLLYQGIAARNFERSFQLADHVQVKGASLTLTRTPYVCVLTPLLNLLA